MRPLLLAAVLALSVAGLAGNVGCHGNLRPVATPVSAAGVNPYRGVPYREEQVARAVIQGAVDRGWVVVQHTPGSVIADVTAGGHGARVRIAYNAGGWRIDHLESSPGLKYQPAGYGAAIHPRYNQWVRRLDESIRRSLVLIAGEPPAPQEVPILPSNTQAN